MEIKPAILFFHFLLPTATFSPLIGTILHFARFSKRSKSHRLFSYFSILLLPRLSPFLMMNINVQGQTLGRECNLRR